MWANDDDQIEIGRQFVPQTSEGLSRTAFERISSWCMAHAASHSPPESALPNGVSSAVNDKRAGAVNLAACKHLLKLAAAADAS